MTVYNQNVARRLINFIFYSLHLFLMFLSACYFVATCQLEFIRLHVYMDMDEI